MARIPRKTTKLYEKVVWTSGCEFGQHPGSPSLLIPIFGGKQAVKVCLRCLANLFNCGYTRTHIEARLESKFIDPHPLGLPDPISPLRYRKNGTLIRKSIRCGLCANGPGWRHCYRVFDGRLEVNICTRCFKNLSWFPIPEIEAILLSRWRNSRA